MAGVAALPTLHSTRPRLKEAAPDFVSQATYLGAPREPIVANGTLAVVGSLGRPPECVSRNDGEFYPSKPDAFGSFVRPPEDSLRNMVPNGPLAPLGSLGRPPVCEPGIASPVFVDWVGERCGTAFRKLFADPTPFAEQPPHVTVAVDGASAVGADMPHGRVGEPPETASGSSVPRRDPTPGINDALENFRKYSPCPGVGLFQAFVWRYKHYAVKISSSCDSPRECFLRYAFASWRGWRLGRECHLRDLRPPAESKAKKRKDRKKRLPAGTVY